MKCDYCGVQITLGNDGGYAPHGIPLYVCKECYKKLSESEIKKTDKQKEETQDKE